VADNITNRAFWCAQLKQRKKIGERLCVFRRNAAIMLLALLSLPLRVARADDTEIESQLKSAYLGNVITLRHFYSFEHLRFHADGTLDGDSLIGPWTLAGQIEVKEIHLRGNLLVIKGRRIQLSIDAKGKTHDQLTTIDGFPETQRDARREALNKLVAEIEIELPEKPDQSAVSSAMNAVFLMPGESMVDIVPAYWHDYFAKQEGKPRILSDQRAGSYEKVVGGAVTPPNADFAPDPDYSLEARKARYQGTVVLSMVVNASGASTNLQIVRPLGLGLDEKAVEAVGTWKFKPGQKDGKPVAVLLMVEVTFRLY
jgi:TonB family protein